MGDCLSIRLLEVIPVGNTLGEGILWDACHRRLWWTDIQEKRLLRYQPHTRTLERFNLPERLGSFGFVEGREDIVAAFESGFAFYHPETNRLTWLHRPRHAAPNVRFNDGRVDRQGRFWAGSMSESADEHGQLYCLQRGVCTSHLSGIRISNSLCVDPDGRALYFADTPLRRIWRFELDEAAGTLSNRQEFVSYPDGSFPDGSATDAHGRIWNAQWGSGRIACYAPDGRLVGQINMPVSQPTCVTFGGEQLNILYVTTARQGLSVEVLKQQPRAGDVFAYQLDVQGLPEARYVP